MIKKYIDFILNLRNVNSRLNNLETELDFLRSKIDIDDTFVETFKEARTSQTYQAAFTKHEPLVSICIGTYNRGHLVTTRSIRSLLTQSYQNIEVIVVGDCCTDDTEKLIGNISDPRLKFTNLPERGNYPSDPSLRWMVAGTVPFNTALSLAKGDFITHLDDDDEHDPERVKKLVTFIQSTKADLVYHPFWYQKDSGRWVTNGAKTFIRGSVTTSSIFYHNWFKTIPWDMKAYKYREPGDWNRLRKIQYIEANIQRCPDVLLRHYKERTQKSK
jgi:glycosyltransferase involved in cell wall biosynthesis